MRTVVLGGTGNFGARIIRGLAHNSKFRVFATCQKPPENPLQNVQYPRLDIKAPDFQKNLGELKPDLVIHCVGPFQGQSYRIPLACLNAGAHYLDMADGRQFVTGFIQHVGPTAQKVNRLAITGVSTIPAITSSVVDRHLAKFSKLNSIKIVTAPAQRISLGIGTTKAVLSYTGVSFPWLNKGKWEQVYGWQQLERVRVLGLRERWAAACDVPDLELFPRRYKDVATVNFRASLQISVQHYFLWMVSQIKRRGLPFPIQRFAPVLNRMVEMMNWFGTDRGGMLVELQGVDSEAKPLRVEWHLVSGSNHGPQIPCMSSLVMAQKIANSQISLRGADVCMGYIGLDEFQREFAKWDIRTETVLK